MDLTILFLVVSVIFLVVGLGGKISALSSRVATLSRIEAKLDLLLRNAGVTFDDPFADLPPPVVQALREGNKIQAIKCYREATGAGLKEAKEFIEEVQRRSGVGA